MRRLLKESVKEITNNTDNEFKLIKASIAELSDVIEKGNKPDTTLARYVSENFKRINAAIDALGSKEVTPQVYKFEVKRGKGNLIESVIATPVGASK